MSDRLTEIFEKHKDGMTIREIAQHYGITYQRVNQLLDKYCQQSMIYDPSKLLDELIILNLKNKMLAASIAKYFNVPRQHVLDISKKSKLSVTNHKKSTPKIVLISKDDVDAYYDGKIRTDELRTKYKLSKNGVYDSVKSSYKQYYGDDKNPVKSSVKVTIELSERDKNLLANGEISAATIAKKYGITQTTVHKYMYMNNIDVRPMAHVLVLSDEDFNALKEKSVSFGKIGRKLNVSSSTVALAFLRMQNDNYRLMTDELEQKIVNDYKELRVSSRVMQKYKISKKSLDNILNKYNIEIIDGRSTRLKKYDEHSIINDYCNGLGIRNICVKYKIGDRRLYKILTKHNVKLKRPNRIKV